MGHPAHSTSTARRTRPAPFASANFGTALAASALLASLALTGCGGSDSSGPSLSSAAADGSSSSGAPSSSVLIVTGSSVGDEIYPQFTLRVQIRGQGVVTYKGLPVSDGAVVNVPQYMNAALALTPEVGWAVDSAFANPSLVRGRNATPGDTFTYTNAFQGNDTLQIVFNTWSPVVVTTSAGGHLTLANGAAIGDTLRVRPSDQIEIREVADAGKLLGPLVVTGLATLSGEGPWSLSATGAGDLEATFQDTSFTDSRGGVTYPLGRLYGAVWMLRNLQYVVPGSAVTAHPSAVELGRLYTWADAQSACPTGFRLPTSAEWNAAGTHALDLLAPVGGGYWTPDQGGTDPDNFWLQGTGYWISGATLTSVGGTVLYWTGGHETISFSSPQGSSSVTNATVTDTHGLSVRCVLDY